MGDNKQLFLSFFCPCSLVLFTGTKGKHFCSVECQRVAVNGSEPRDARRIQSRVSPAFLMRESVSACLTVKSSFWMPRKEVSINPLPSSSTIVGLLVFQTSLTVHGHTCPFQSQRPCAFSELTLEEGTFNFL